MEDKFERTGMHAVKSQKVETPIVEEYSLTLERVVVEVGQAVSGYRVVEKIVGILAKESVLDEKEKVDPAKLNAFVYDEFQRGYYAQGEKIGQAWKSGAAPMK